MIANVLFATTILFIALLFFLVQECAFLIPFRRLLIEKYGSQIAIYAAAVFSMCLPVSTSPRATCF